MKWLFVVMMLTVTLVSVYFIFRTYYGSDTRIVSTTKTLGKGEYVTVSGKLKRNFFGDFTAGGYKFDPDNRTYWSCVDKSKSRDEIINMGDFVNSFRFYMRPPINESELAVLLDKKSQDNGWVQVTGDLDKKKHLFTSTKAILIYDCLKE